MHMSIHESSDLSIEAPRMYQSGNIIHVYMYAYHILIARRNQFEYDKCKKNLSSLDNS